ncbi:hemolysin III family protein [Tenacibaculum maritimum]|uniref:PAQR family membrane homeostasis protein TrhA n=1 Tax=Tenacibaculum maritimum TaxID=107401 RepID=UPI0012E472A3|nr:hemolysin III family protein [Tenacibaculum maritimum]CAA0157028.1 Probable transmembrane hypothetical protein. Hemolysin-3 family [Tenacibaculum maritimum]
MNENLNHHYSQKEERLNVLSHGLGFLLSLVAFPFLIFKSLDYSSCWQSTSFIVYGLSLITLYGASTFYHASKEPKTRRKLNILDHAAIYVLIAGTYSPFCLVALKSVLGWYMFIFVWFLATAGVIAKLFFTGRFDKISTILYVLMGWQVVFFGSELYRNLSQESLYSLVLGGIFYTIGALFYSVNKMNYNHTIFHVFVLLGSLSHFIAIFLIAV